MPWLGTVEKPFGDEPSRVLAQASLTKGAELLIDKFRSSLGPKGMMKLITQPFPMRDEMTSDGKTILTSMGTVHPGAWLMREMAYTQINLGDGVTTTMVLAGELLKNSKKLLDMKVKPALIIRGYREAMWFSKRTLRRISRPVDWRDHDQMFRVARTAAGTKNFGIQADRLAEFSTAAVLAISSLLDGKPAMDMRDICVLKVPGSSTTETKLLSGIAFVRGLRNPGMPKRIDDPKIALLTCPLEFKSAAEQNTPIRLEIGPGMIASVREERLRMVRRNVDKIVGSGANVVVTSKRIEELHASLMAEKGIQAVHHIPELGGVARLAKASGGKAVGLIDDLRNEDLGHAAFAEEVKIPRTDTRRLEKEVKTGNPLPEEERMFVIDGCKDPKSMTILIRGQVESGLGETERAVFSALSACQALVWKPRVVGGAGSTEAELAHRVRRFALRFNDKMQLAIVAYAEALEGLVEVLAGNAGIDPLDAKLGMTSAHAAGHRWMGMDFANRRLGDAFEMGVVEPLTVKESAITIASESACQLVRIDRVLRGYHGQTLIPGEIPPGASEGPNKLEDANDLPEETIKAFRKSRFVKPYGSKLELNL
jgi:chaperonin GroEL (HSP60 family)